jgi:hypothetical protein
VSKKEVVLPTHKELLLLLFSLLDNNQTCLSETFVNSKLTLLCA